jgi:DnaJ-class molecular chaperone
MLPNPCNERLCRTTKTKILISNSKGVDDHTKKIIWKGDAGYRGGSNVDFYVLINVEKHKIFQMSDENLYYKLPISK